MEELVKMIMDRTGVSESQARQAAATTTINYLKDRLPSSASSEIDALIGAQAAGGVGAKVGEVAGKIEGAIRH